MENYITSQRSHIFKDVKVLIYVFDVESKHFAQDLTYYQLILEAILQYSKDAQIFCLIHKMDLVMEEQRETVFREREAELKRRSLPLDIVCFKTSIWDESLYKVPLILLFIRVNSCLLSFFIAATQTFTHLLSLSHTSISD